MKKLNLLAILITISYSLFTAAQQSNLDSLKHVWTNENEADTVRLIALYHIRESFIFTNPDSALSYGRIQYDFAKAKDQKRYMADGLIFFGSFYITRNDSIASDYLKKGAALAEEIKYWGGWAECLKSQGNIQFRKGENARALEYYEKGLEISEKHHIKNMSWKMLNNMGNVYNAMDNYPMALSYFHKSLMTLSEEGSPSQYFKAVMLFNIAGIYKTQKDYDKALEYYQKSLDIATNANVRMLMGGLMANIGEVYGIEENYANALNYLNQSIEIYEELDNNLGIASTLQSMAEIHFKQGDLQKAVDFSQRNFEISKLADHKLGMVNALNFKGNIFRLQGQYALAIKECKKGYDLAKTIHAQKGQKEACECLYNTYKKTENPQQALAYHERLVVLNDSLFNEESTKEITRMEMQYEFDKQEAATKAEQVKKDALAMQELEREKMIRNVFMGGFGVVLLFAGVFFTQRNRISKEKKRSENLLHNILPAEVAAELKEKGESEARDFDDVTVLFTDFVSFTQTAEKLTAKELVSEINTCFKAFDAIVEKYSIEKIKTIGDAYMAAGGLYTPRISEPKDVAKAATEMQAFMLKRKAEHSEQHLPYFDMRVGIHTGPVVAGIVGVKKFQYDIWGDTVNTASRMESNGEVGRVNISQATYELLKDDPQFTFESRGKVDVKGKGEMQMWFVDLQKHI